MGRKNSNANKRRKLKGGRTTERRRSTALLTMISDCPGCVVCETLGAVADVTIRVPSGRADDTVPRHGRTPAVAGEGSHRSTDYDSERSGEQRN